MSNWSVSYIDLDPERLSVTHMFQFRIEFQPRTDPERPGGSYTWDVPGYHWVKILEAALTAMTEEEVYALVDQYTEA